MIAQCCNGLGNSSDRLGKSNIAIAQSNDRQGDRYFELAMSNKPYDRKEESLRHY
jgi:hypothetical protein